MAAHEYYISDGKDPSEAKMECVKCNAVVVAKLPMDSRVFAALCLGINGSGECYGATADVAAATGEAD